MIAEVYLEYNKDSFVAKESFLTLKRRLYDNQPFMDITTDDGRKGIYNKEDIMRIEAAEEAK